MDNKSKKQQQLALEATTTKTIFKLTTKRKPSAFKMVSLYSFIIATIVVATTTLVSQSYQLQPILPTLLGSSNHKLADGNSNSPVRVESYGDNNNNSPATRLLYYQHQHQQQQQPTQLSQHLSPSQQHNVHHSSHHQTLIGAAAGHRQQQNSYTDAAVRLLLDLRQQMLNRSIKFDENFQSLLSDSKRGLHNMFLKTYGLYYELNTDIFTNMFEDLEQYYAKGQIKIADSMKNFFDRLYQKVFQAFNVGKQFSPDYLHCVRAQVASLRPFKDVPDKIIDGIRHGFVAARSFRLALDRGVEVIKAIVSLEHTNQCNNLINENLIKALHEHDALSPPMQPCTSFCEQVLTRCFARDSLERLDESWKSYTFSLNKLAQKLSTSYNIETIVAPMDVQISEAIMNFQENGQNITDHVFNACGAPRPMSGAISGGGGGGGNVRMAASIVGPIDSGKLKDSGLTVDSYGETSMPVRAPTNRLKRRARAASIRARQYAAATASSQTNRNQEQASSYSSAFGSLMLDQNDRAQRPSGGSKPNHMISQQTPGAVVIHHSNHPKDSSVMRSPEIIDEIKRYIQSTRNFWSTLPNSVCMASNQTFNDHPPSIAAALAKNRQQQSGAKKVAPQWPYCYSAQLMPHEINFDMRYRTEIQHITGQLDRIRDKVEQAFLGIEVEWDSLSVPAVIPHIRPTMAGLPNTRPIVIPSAGNSGFGGFVTSTSTTTVAPADDEDEESTEDELDPSEDGAESGDDGSDAEPDDSGASETDTLDEPTEDYDSETEPLETETAQSTTLMPLTEPPDNTLNDSNEPAGIPGELVTAPKRSSGQSSSKLVIQSCWLGFGFELNAVASFLMFVVMMLNHQQRQF